jgi:hypothetical protein
MTTPLILLTVIAGAHLTPALASEVHVVDASEGGDFTSLAAAAEVAADGDVLLVRPGNYPHSMVVIDGKSLTIVKDGAGVVKSNSSIHVRNLPADKEVHLSGLSYPDTYVYSNSGHVLIEGFEPAYYSGDCMLHISDSSSVTVTDSVLRGTDGWDITHGEDNYGADGLLALEVTDSTVTLYATDAEGGSGDDGAWLPCGIGGDGGAGLLVHDTASRVRHSGCTFTEGIGGYGGCGDGYDGNSIDATSGTVIPLTMPVNTIRGEAVIREGDVYTISVRGTPGLSPMLLTSTKMDHRILPPSFGVLHHPLPFAIDAMPPIPGSGVLEFDIPIPMLPDGADSRWRIMQVVMPESAGRYLTRPISLLVLDEGL